MSKFSFAFVLLLLLMPLTGHSQASFALLCKATVQNQLLTRVIKLDPQKQMVDDSPAIYSDTQITWTTVAFENWSKRVVYLDHHLNRLSGTYYADSRGGAGIAAGPPTSFTCEKAPTPKF